MTPDFVHQSNLIENINDPREDKQSWRAWRWLATQDHISHATVKTLHAMITRHNLHKKYRGEYRAVHVRVGLRTCPAPHLAQQLIHNWILDLAEYGDKLDPIAMHIRFEHIHPFVDGNGRTGRMLMWWHQLKLGQEPTLISFENRRQYYDWFKEDK